MRDIKKLWVVSMVLLLPLSVMAEEDNQGDMVAEGGRL
jgi:hypothetical protein